MKLLKSKNKKTRKSLIFEISAANSENEKMEAEVDINQNKFVWKSNELDSVIFKKDVESDLVKI